MGGGGSLGSEGALESVTPAIRWDPQKVCPSPGRGTGLESRLWDKVSLEVTRWSGAERRDAPPIFRVTRPPGKAALAQGHWCPLTVAFPGCCAHPPPHPRCAQSQGLEDLATSPHLSCAPPSGSQRPRPHPVSVAGSVSRAGAPPRPQVLSFPGTAHLRSHSSRRLGAEAWGFCSHESKQTVKASFPPSRAQQGWRGALVGQDTAGTGRLGVTG